MFIHVEVYLQMAPKHDVSVYLCVQREEREKRQLIKYTKMIETRVKDTRQFFVFFLQILSLKLCFKRTSREKQGNPSLTPKANQFQVDYRRVKCKKKWIQDLELGQLGR